MFLPTILRSSIFGKLALLVVLIPAHAHALSSEERETVELFFADQDRVVVSTRTPKPLSQTAENITVVTSAEIEAMNAHTLADVFNVVTGIQLDVRGGPGSLSAAYIQRSDYSHIRFLIDGVSLNMLVTGAVDPGSIPVQHIERIEIIKGPASSSWGSALGGVVNIITKSPPPATSTGALLSYSRGERSTTDARGELEFRRGRVGAYMTGSYLATDGFQPHNSVYNPFGYAKLGFDIGQDADLTLSLGYMRTDREDGAFSGEFPPLPPMDSLTSDNYENFFSSIRYRKAISSHADFSASFRLLLTDLAQINEGAIAGVMPFSLDYALTERSIGGSAGVSWWNDRHNIGFGIDYDNGNVDRTDKNFGINFAEYDRAIDKWGIYLTDTIIVGRLSVTPGGRFDRSSIYGDEWSGSLGATYRVSPKTIARAYGGSGFSFPAIAGGSSRLERALAYQAGIETSAIPYLWLKGTILHNERHNVRLPSAPYGRSRTTGFEAEAKTASFYDVALGAGFALMHADESGDSAHDYTVDVKVIYENEHSVQMMLIGHYIWWDENPAVLPMGSYDDIIWDVTATKKISLQAYPSFDIFASAHNIFDGQQHPLILFKNPGRWVEAGMRLRF